VRSSTDEEHFVMTAGLPVNPTIEKSLHAFVFELYGTDRQTDGQNPNAVY